MKAVHAIIDSGGLAIPQKPNTSFEIPSFVQFILFCKDLLISAKYDNVSLLGVYLCNSAELFQDDVFPRIDSITQLLKRQNERVVDTKTLVPVIHRILRECEPVSYCKDLPETVWSNLSVRPDLLSECLTDGLRKGLSCCIVNAALASEYQNRYNSKYRIVVRYSPSITIRVGATIQRILSHPKDCLGGNVVFPHRFSGEVKTVHDPCALAESLDVAYLAEILKRGWTDNDMLFSIQLSLYKFRIRAATATPEIISIARVKSFVGRRFLESVRECCRNNPKSLAAKLLRAIWETVDKRRMNAVHRLRTGSAGGARQRIRSRDGANAWRRDVDPEYHLHYWKKADGQCELAKVAVHNSFDIPD